MILRRKENPAENAIRAFCVQKVLQRQVSQILFWKSLEGGMGLQFRYEATAGFEGARHVNILPEWHQSRRLHGHSFTAKIRTFLPLGWADFPGSETGALARLLATCIAPLN